MIEQSEGCAERAAAAIRDEIFRRTRGRPMRWVMVHEVAERLGMEDDVAENAVRSAIDRGWFVGDGEPPHSIRLSSCSIQKADPMQELS
jgi:hypothetical protein